MAARALTEDETRLLAGEGQGMEAKRVTVPRAAIAVVGSINMDLVTYTSRAPRAGETVLGTGFRTAHGGKGANQAVAAARLGGDVVMIGCVGSDGFGVEMRRALEQEGIDVSGVRTVPGPSGVAAITVEEDGQNRIVVVPGANARLERLTDDDRKRIARCRFLLLQLESPLPVVTEAARVARAAGVTVMLTPSPARPLPEELRAAVDWFIPNETELQLLTDLPTRSHQEVEAAARRLGAGRAHVVVTLGERGCLYVPPAGEALAVPALPVQAVDTTAAGDTFTGALAVALGEGRPVADALHFSVRAAGIAVTRPGAQPSMPFRAEVEVG